MSINNDLDAKNTENQDDIVFSNSIEDLSKANTATEDMPDVDVTTTRKSSNAKKLKMMALGVLAMLIALVATGVTFNRATDARQARKAQEAEEAVAARQNLKTNSSRIDIGDDQAELEALNGLPVPADAMAEPIMMDNMAQPIAAMPAPTSMPDSTPSYAPVMMPEPTSPPMASGASAPPMQSLQDMGMFDNAPQVEYAPPPPTPEELKRQRLLSGNVMAFETAGRTAVTTADSGRTPDGAYKATALSNGSASKRGDTSMVLMRGTSIPCVLRTKIVSDYKGFTTCQVSKNIYSANGKVLLIERGSKVFGEQNIEIKQGQSSVFVLWTRVETPKGISVNLESPATGQLGEMGVKADVKNHFWKRFGGAIMLSLIQDSISAGTSRLESKDGGENNTTVQSTSRTTESMAEKALDNTINIPPTATVPQGTLMNILVVRDVDFGGVYGLRK